MCVRNGYTKCGKIPNAVYGELKKAGATGCQRIKFFCSVCDKLFEKITIDIKEMINKQIDFEINQRIFEKGLEEDTKNICRN